MLVETSWDVPLSAARCGARLAACTALCCFAACSAGCGSARPAGLPLAAPGEDGVYHVYPGEEIQAAIEAAAGDPLHKTVRVHAGIYRPPQPRQALIWIHGRHDGILLEAEGDVVLTAANEEIADKSAGSFPAVVNHVVYFGDGVTPRTQLRGFKITGANHFVTRSEEPQSIQPPTGVPELYRTLFFYADGGGIKIFGRSYPTIVDVEVYDNYTSPCGGGVSIEHCGFNDQAVTLRNCIFRNNRCQITGSAVDLLPGSSAVIENCLFVGNVSNTGPDYVGTPDGPYNAEHGSGALTVFPDSRVTVTRCTFTGNWNGVDDKGIGNVYTESIFWRNNKPGGISSGGRYEIDILDGSGVSGCFFGGDQVDLRGSIAPGRNVLNAPDPDFDAQYRPRAQEYAEVGYRPKLSRDPSAAESNQPPDRQGDSRKEDP